MKRILKNSLRTARRAATLAFRRAVRCYGSLPHSRFIRLLLKGGVSSKESSLKSLKTLLVSAIIALVVMLFGTLEAYLGINLADDLGDFLLAPLLLILLGLAVGAFVLAASEKTSTLAGTLIGITMTLLVVLVTAVWSPFQGIDLSSVLLGLIGLALFMAAIAVVWVGMRFYKRGSFGNSYASSNRTFRRYIRTLVSRMPWKKSAPKTNTPSSLGSQPIQTPAPAPLPTPVAPTDPNALFTR